MQDILFKGRRIDNGEWIEGNYIQKMRRDREEPIFWCCLIQDMALSACLVSPVTVTQFTGLKDRTGIKIFEKDIIHYSMHKGYFMESFDAVVVYDDKFAAFGYQKITKTGAYEKQPIHYFTEHHELEIDVLPYIDVVGHVNLKNKIL